jgi:hypothetical protein
LLIKAEAVEKPAFGVLRYEGLCFLDFFGRLSLLAFFAWGLVKAGAVEKPAFGVLRSRTPTAHRW